MSHSIQPFKRIKDSNGKSAKTTPFRVAEDAKVGTSNALLLSSNALSLSWPAMDVYKAGTSSTVLHGETSSTLWTSSNHSSAGSAPADTGYSCSYAVVVHNRATNEAHLVSAPLHVIQPTLKAQIKSKISPAMETDRSVQRADLGIAFGSKKAQRNIRAADRNQLDVTTADMQTYQDLLQTSLHEVLKAMPSADDLKSLQHEGKPIPKANADATEPANIYPIDDVVPAEVLRGIPAARIAECSSPQQWRSMLPVQHSNFVNQRLDALLQGLAGGLKKTGKKRLSILYYLSALFLVAKTRDYKNLEKKLRGVLPDAVADHLLELYSEEARGSSSRKVTAFTQAKASLHLLVLALHVDAYSVRLRDLANDMDISPQSLRTMFRTLGCHIAYPRAEATEDSLEKKGRAGDAQAILRLPLEFPEVKRKRKRA